MPIENARPYVFDEAALRKAAARLEELASPLRLEDARADGAGGSSLATASR
jgi:hypothetical protein